ncbi:MAG: amino acid ABC transporter permease [Deinococcota bacterium]
MSQPLPFESSSAEAPSSPSETPRRPLARLRPSYFVFLTALPFALYLFFTAPSYQNALRFIAPGLLVTVIVTVVAYVVASLLGLGLAALLVLQTKSRTVLVYSLLVAALAGLSSFFFTRPQVTYSLVGTTEGRVAILQGTPGRISNAVRDGQYAEDAEGMPVRAVETPEAALERLTEGRVSAALLPQEVVPDDLPHLWTVTFLPNSARNPALSLAVLAILLGILTVAGWQTEHHPLAIFAELYIDMIRGIPMLVIILYVGFPLQGALRDISGGIINMSRITRGIVGISLGYAAYMAEIFRAGIEAIPKGQFEAARSLGLNGWQTAFYIILPQALKIVIPPLGNEFIAMLKDTSLLSILSVRDITQRAREFQASNFIVFPPFNTVAMLYIGLTLAASSLVKFVERRTKRGL